MPASTNASSLWEFFNTREWAIGIWLVIGVALASVVAGKSVMGTVKAVLNRHIVGATLIFLAAVGFIVFICDRIGLWNLAQLKTTILWVVFVAPGLVGRMITNEEQPRLLKAWFKESVSAAILIELIINTYTFAIWIELLLVPFLVFLGAMLAVAQGKPEYKAVVTFLNNVFALIGMYILGRGLWLIASHWSAFATLGTMRDAYTAPMLSLALIPFLYVFYLYVRYETAFAPLQLSIEDAKLRDYAKAMAIVTFHVRTPLLRRWQKQLSRVRPTTHGDVVKTLKAVIRGYNREKSPPAVDADQGWSPVIAGKYLAAADVIADDYHETYGGVWYTEASFKRPKESAYGPHGLSYAIEGDEDAAHELRLRFYINGPENSDAESLTFAHASQLLFESALPPDQAMAAGIKLKEGKPFAIDGPTRVSLEYEDLSVNAYVGGEWVLSLRRPPTVPVDTLAPELADSGERAS